MPWETLTMPTLSAECYLDVPVTQFLKYECFISDDELKTTLDSNKILPLAEKAIKGLKIRTLHSEQPRTYRVQGITKQGANCQKFVMEEGDKKRTITVADYFKEYLGYNLEFPELNCLHVGNPQRTIYIPIEVCKIEKGQKKQPCQFDHYPSSLRSPGSLSLGSDSFSFNYDDITNEKWNENNFSTAPEVTDWAVLNYDMEMASKQCVTEFLNKFTEVAKEKGMRINDPCVVFHSPQPNPFSDFEVCKTRSKGDLQLVMCIIGEMKGLYEAIKYADQNSNVLTQCLQSKNILSFKDSMIVNVLIKIKHKMTK